MLQVFHDSGFPVSVSRVDGCLEFEFPTSLSREARERFEDRQRAADVAAVAHVLRPASVAVIGASRRPGTVGGEVVRNLLAAGYSGPLHLVNAKGAEVAGRPTVRSIAEVEEDVELAIIAVPAAAVVETARQCAAKGVRALVVLTAGFAEVGAEGRARQDELLAVCRAAGMRMVGPNCLGVANLHHQTALNATFAPGEPTPGSVAFASQSGAFGIAAIDEAAARGIGLSSFVSMGDKADLSGNDFMEYWEQDPDTAVLLLYLESFGNPRRFGRIARRITQDKPIVAVKSGRTAAGQRAASSHTGALLAASRRHRRRAVRARRACCAPRRWGRCSTSRPARAAAAAPRRPRRGAYQRRRPGHPLRRRLRGRGPADRAAVGGDAGAARRGAAAGGLDREPGRHDRLRDRRPVRALAAHPARGRRRRRGGDDLRAAARHARGRGGPRDRRRGRGQRPAGARRLARRRHAGVRRHRRRARASPRPSTPCGRSAHAVRYARHRAAPADPPFEPADADIATAATIVAEGLGRGGGWLPPDEVERLLTCWGIPVAASRLVGVGAGRRPRRGGARRRRRAQGRGARAGAQERRGRGAPRADRPDRRDTRRPRDGGRARGGRRAGRGIPRPADGARPGPS